MQARQLVLLVILPFCCLCACDDDPRPVISDADLETQNDALDQVPDELNKELDGDSDIVDLPLGAPCSSSEQCAEEPYPMFCYEDICQRSACDSDQDCAVNPGSLQACSIMGQCGDCGKNLPCSNGLSCFTWFGVCIPACSSDSDCASFPGIPVCDGICVECKDQGDCPPGKQCHYNHCEPLCTQDSDCGSLYCVAGQCVSCRNAEDCGAGTCVDGDCRCTSDSQCSGGRGEHCLGSGDCGCEDDTHCPEGRHCDLESQGCNPCVLDEHCSDSNNGRACLGSTCGCRSDGDCAGVRGEVCDTFYGICGCIDNDDCVGASSGSRCTVDGLCGCTVDTDCPDGICLGRSCLSFG
jgi:hypothetical protein